MQLSFNQKVGLGFAIIILLLMASGMASLYTLWTIEGSTTRVNEEAVPILKESNRVQIQLLKLAKLSSLAFNAPDTEKIQEYRTGFEAGVEKFDGMQKNLGILAASNAATQEKFNAMKADFDHYLASVNEMFEAKLELLAAEQRTDDKANELLGYVDEVGTALSEIMYPIAPISGHDKEMEMVIGSLNSADDKKLGIVKAIDEIKRTMDPFQLGEAEENFIFILNDSKRLYDVGAGIFKEFDQDGLTDLAYQKYDELQVAIRAKPGIADHRALVLKQMDISKKALEAADKAVSASVATLDGMLEASDTQFNTLQSDVFSRLDLGFKTSIGMMVVLILLAAQNFNSMRTAIRKKMADLAKLNKVGGLLAAAQSQSAALEEVLQCMNEKIGVNQGSVFLTDDTRRLKLKACFPPKAIKEGQEAAKFALGQGVLGKVAETKQVVFVPNTANEKSFEQKEGDVPKALLCVPLVDKDMLVGVINLSGDVKDVAFADSDYEFVASVSSSLVTTIKSLRMREVIEEQNRNLEKKVEERTAALAQKNRDIASMMSNMHQGLFTIMNRGLIHPEYATYLEAIFETKRIAERNFSDLLFSNTTLSVDAVDQCVTAVDSIVGEDEMMYDFNSHCLAKEMVIKMEDGREKILEMDWDPIIANGITEKLMLTVRDVTELRALEREAEGQKRELEVIGQILAIEARKFKEFIDTSVKYMAECRSLIEEHQTKDMTVIASLFRNMHTVKGNARTYGLTHIAAVVHAAESTYDDMRKHQEAPWEQARLLRELAEAEAIVGKYSVVNDEKLGRGGESSAGLSLDPERLTGWIKRIQSMTSDDMTPPVKGVVSEAYKMLMSFDTKPLSNAIESVVDSVESLATQLGKAAPLIDIDDGDYMIKSEAHGMLNNVFMHIFRNAIDHGIEMPEERKAKGKPEKGTISINNIQGDGFVSLTVRDDGRGMALNHIYKLAVEKGIYSADQPRPDSSEIAKLIFASGFSTAKAVTDVSGRGVGMDAVKSFLEKAGGGIDVVLDPGDDSAEFRSFSIEIRLPEKYYMVAPIFAKSA
jgi:two-component system chemotaxis sensor kinase CheA